MDYSTSAPNERVWRITQLANLSFNHPSVALTADVFQFFIKRSHNKQGSDENWKVRRNWTSQRPTPTNKQCQRKLLLAVESEVTLGVILVSLRRFAYDARSRCHSFVRLRWDGDSSFIPLSLHDGRLNPELVPRASPLKPPGFPSKIRLPQYNPNTCAQVITGLSMLHSRQ